jgi:Sel1 repeat
VQLANSGMFVAVSIHSRAASLAGVCNRFVVPTGDDCDILFSLGTETTGAGSRHYERFCFDSQYFFCGIEVSDQASTLAMASYADNRWDASRRVTTPADAEVINRINVWFVQHGIAWAGTPGELAHLIGRGSEELRHALEAASVTLLVFGISASVLRRPGQPTIISLRRLEEIDNSVDIVGNRRQPPGSEHAVERTIGQGGWATAVEDTSAPIDEPPSKKGDAMEPALELHLSEPLDSEPAEPLPLATLSSVADPPSKPYRNLLLALSVTAVVAVLLITIRHRATVNGTSNGSPSQHSELLQETEGRDSAEGVKHATRRSAEIDALYQRARENNADAQYQLGLRLLRGEGLPRNESEAATWFDRAARMGDARAQLELGMAYTSGQGVAPDQVTGYTWLTLAATSGNAEAETALRGVTPKLAGLEIARVRWNLAEMYKNGVGTRADKSAAYIWYSLAEAAGEQRSARAKNELASTMTPEQVSDANAAALSWLKKHRM